MNNTDHQVALAIKGWQIDHITPAQIRAAHRFYLVEPENGSLCQIVVIPIEAFNAISPAPSALQYSNFLNQTLLSLTYKSTEISPEEFVTILTSYYKATESFKETKHLVPKEKPMDVLINLYGKVGSLSTAIRPVVLQPMDTPYPANDVLELAQYVMNTDRERNPEFFNTP